MKPETARKYKEVMVELERAGVSKEGMEVILFGIDEEDFKRQMEDVLGFRYE